MIFQLSINKARNHINTFINLLEKLFALLISVYYRIVIKYSSKFDFEFYL